MKNRSIFTILAIFLFTFATVNAKIDAKPIKLQAMMDKQLIESMQDHSAATSNQLRAIIDIR
ncbi:MAG: hypothetical protein AAB373_02305 [Patescibacteria group bacterium]